MRVVAGEAKGHHLRAPKGTETRPTSDKVREAIFSILGESFVDCSVLDLFAGSGALGIEALSRGASSAVFVERRPAACEIIRSNLQHTGFTGESRLLCMSVERAMKAFDEQFGLVLLDPPYAQSGLDSIMTMIAGSRVLENNTLVVFEHAPRFTVQERYGRLALRREKVYGDTAISIYVAQEVEDK